VPVDEAHVSGGEHASKIQRIERGDPANPAKRSHADKPMPSANPKEPHNAPMSSRSGRALRQSARKEESDEQTFGGSSDAMSDGSWKDGDVDLVGFDHLAKEGKMAELIDSGEIGDVYYVDSTRVNLGLFQRDVSVICDLAVHDFAIMDHLLKRKPRAVSANGVNHFPGTPENLAYVTLYYDGGTIGHVNVSWLAPVKVRQIVVGGSRRMIAYDDLQPSDKIKVYDRGVEMSDDPQRAREMRVGYRSGDMWSPQLGTTEALRIEGEHFVDWAFA
jgi:hypothetical protein